MSQEVSNYVYKGLGNPTKIDSELLLVAQYLVERWKNPTSICSDENVAEHLKNEEFDDFLMEDIRLRLLEFAQQSDSIELFQQAVSVLGLYEDPRMVPLFKAWLLTHVRNMINENSAVYSLLHALDASGEAALRKGDRGLDEIEKNALDAKKYLDSTLGVKLLF